ncbi:hypothetical protein CTAYLR_009031 [Chrysophaeum taylorii]|uniref:DNA helicase n=1 Tax=Chrysophaeum taylorii TaxID=2483200 RepID=A0AAD7UEL2_9STRA|nr:hypothetical protein CTAYLR_009031 [Chrysophaeum taylorii]
MWIHLVTMPCSSALRAPTSMSTAGVDASSSKARVVVVGAGWGGFGAAKALSENGCDVTLVDAGNPVEEMRTPTGKPFEPGMRGFWKDYPNINALGDELELGDVYSPFTESSFFGPYGLECSAPVFSGSPELPSPLGQVAASFDRFKRLPIVDRMSILGLFGAMADLNRSPEIFEAYDRMTAHELFLRVGVTKRLVDDFLKPTLLVGLFKPPEELSAAVTMELLYYYALAHQTSFDVRWLKRGTVQSTFFAPLAKKLVDEGNVTLRGNCYVQSLEYDARRDKIASVAFKDRATGQVESMACDAVVLALGANGMRSVVAGSPAVAKRCPELSRAASLNAIDVIAVRLWLDKVVDTDTPVGVFSKFPALRGAGGTFFMLDQLLDPDTLADSWAGQDGPRGSVLSCDFYNAGALLSLSDDEISRILLEDLLPRAYPAFANARLRDFHVKRFPRAVSWFSPGSFQNRPPLVTTVDNLVCAGDWVRMGKDYEHGAKGLCQERALVSGYQAANVLAAKGVLGADATNTKRVLPVRDDEPQYLATVRANGLVQGALDRVGVGSFWRGNEEEEFDLSFGSPLPAVARTPGRGRVTKSLKTGLATNSSSSSARSKEIVVWKDHNETTVPKEDADLSRLWTTVQEDMVPPTSAPRGVVSFSKRMAKENQRNRQAWLESSPVGSPAPAFGNRLSFAAEETCPTLPRLEPKPPRRRNALRPLDDNDLSARVLPRVADRTDAVDDDDEFGDTEFGDDALAEIEDMFNKIENDDDDAPSTPSGLLASSSSTFADPYGGDIDWDNEALVSSLDAPPKEEKEPEDDDDDDDDACLFAPLARYPSMTRLEVVSVSSADARHQRLAVRETAARAPRSCELELRQEWAEPALQPGDVVHAVALAPLVGEKSRDDDAFAELSRDGVVDSSSPYVVIAHPELFVSPTRVSDATSCERKALLGHILGSARSRGKALVLGSLKHELFGAVIQNVSKFAASPSARDVLIKEVVGAGTPQLYGLGVDSPAQIERDCREFVDGVLEDWAPKFVAADPGFRGDLVLPASAGDLDGARTLAIRDVVAIENGVWSPVLGVSGHVDVTVEVDDLEEESANGSENKGVRTPLELKSGREHVAHGAQVALYVGVERANQLLRRRAAAPDATRRALGGLLLYAAAASSSFDGASKKKHKIAAAEKDSERTRMRHVNVSAAETRSILAARNRVADALHRSERRARAAEEDHRRRDKKTAATMPTTTVLPGPIQNRNECKRCFSLATCALHHFAAENGDAASFGCGDDVWERALSGPSAAAGAASPALLLTEADRAYYKSWMTLLDLEAAMSTPAARLVLSRAGADRERAGEPCVANLRGTTSVVRKDHSFGGDPQFVVSLERDHHHHLYEEEEEAATSLTAGDFALVSVERGTGARRRVSLVGRGVISRLDSSGGRLSMELASHAPVDLPRDASVRVDKDETTSCIAKARNNLASLFVDVNDNARDDNDDDKKGTEGPPKPLADRKTARAARRRSLRAFIVDGARPRFDENKARTALDVGVFSGDSRRARWGGDGCGREALEAAWGRLNDEQRRAAERVLAAEDYALVLGMPGTGKTSTIEFVARCLVALGKRVLVSSYTHSAVDNVLLKLLENGMSPRYVARLAAGASRDKVDPRLASRVVDDGLATQQQPNRLGILRSRLGRARVVGCTCLSAAADPLLARIPEFDVAIVDEAGQISQPVVLAPLFEARTFVLVGDPHQLAPLSTSALARSLGASVSLFERLADAQPDAVAVLSLQYRMNKPIMDLCNASLAADAEMGVRRLACGSETVATATLGLDDDDDDASATWLRAAVKLPVVFLDVPASSSAEEAPTGGTTRNDAEARVVGACVAELIRLGAKPSDLAVLTPFRAQLKAIEDELGDDTSVETSTVDRFQGRDAPCVILSFSKRTDATRCPLLNDARRINVALSRAKRKLVLVGCAEVLANQSSIFARLLATLGQAGAVVRVDSLSSRTQTTNHRATKKTHHALSWHPPRSTNPVLHEIVAETVPCRRP